MKRIIIAICIMFVLLTIGRVLVAEEQQNDQMQGKTVQTDGNKDNMQGKATTEEPTTKKPIYKCPMHPEVPSDKPGKCPKCGMNLEKVAPKEDKR